MSLKEALALLDNRIYIKPKVPFFVRLVQCEKMLRSERSLYALKTAVAVSVLAVFLLAPSLQGFFVQYSLTGGLITLVVALAPSLGQSIVFSYPDRPQTDPMCFAAIFTFALQIGGVGIGSIYGMVVLFIFRDVGGFSFNPVSRLLFLSVPWLIGRHDSTEWSSSLPSSRCPSAGFSTPNRCSLRSAFSR